MSMNLVIWKWGDEFATPYSRRKRKLKMGDVATALVREQVHESTGDFDQDEFLQAVAELYPEPAEERPFVIEQYPRHIVVNIPLQSQNEVVPEIGELAMSLGLNAAEE